MTEISTQVVKAGIYRRGAEVIRAGRAELAEGVQTLRVLGVTAGTDADTVRIYSQEGVTCSDLRAVPLYRDGEEPKEITEIRDRIGVLQKRIEAKKLQVELWKTNGDFSGRSKQPAGEVQSYIEKLAERLEGLNAEIRAAEKEIEALNRQLEKMDTSGLAFEVLVNARTAGKYRFELKYFENRARWLPVYEVRADGEGPLEMKLRADIRQSTGEDWKDVELSLYTGNPTSAGTVPELRPALLDIRRPMTAERGRNAFAMGAAPMMKSAAMDDACLECEEAEVQMLRMETQEAEIRQDETSTQYVLPGKRDVLNEDDGNLADVRTFSIGAAYRIVTVPKLDPGAYLVAAVAPSDLPVAGRINPAVYYKEVYTGKVWLDPDLTRDEIEITLGREERIHVNRRQTLRKSSTTLLKGLRVTEYGYETRLSNNSEADTILILKDQVPVSENKEISVDVTEISGAELDRETGILTKKIRLPAGQSEVFRLGYKVSCPKDKSIEERPGSL